MIDLKKINYTKLIKYSFPLTLLVIIIIAIWFLFFFYINIYLAMIQTNEVSEFKKESVNEMVKKQELAEIILEIDNRNIKKQKNKELNFDPFYPQKAIENSNTTSVNETTDSVESEVEVETAINN